MFSLFDAINHYLGFFNFNLKLKNQIYTIMGFIGNWYLLHLAIQLFKNQLYLRGFLFALIFLVLLYFSILNLVYYFTSKTVKGDISPHIEKIFGGKPKDADISAPISPNPFHTQPGTPVMYDPVGIYDQNNLISATLTSTDAQREVLKHIADHFLETHHIQENYQGLNDQQVTDFLKKSNLIAFDAIGTHALIPSYKIVTEENQLHVYAGLNILDQQLIGSIETVGTFDIHDLQENYQLLTVSCILHGGKCKTIGRSGLIESIEPYFVEMKIAYQRKTNEPKNTN